MHLRILGSGGCTATPRPGCECPVCTEAREKGVPYSRTGPSLFVENINALVDTPEEIVQQLNRENIHQVEYILYTHWHPDHTMGMRVVEQLNMEYLRWFIEGQLSSQKTTVCAVSEVMEDLKKIRNPSGSYCEFYENHGLISLKELKETVPFNVGKIEITPFLIENPYHLSTSFVIQKETKKIAYAPCDCKPFIEHELLKDLDVLIIGNVLPEGKLKNDYILPENNQLRREAFTIEELLEIIERWRVKRTIVTHIEEEYGKSFDEYKEIEEEYRKYNIYFAYDGMRIEI